MTSRPYLRIKTLRLDIYLYISLYFYYKINKYKLFYCVKYKDLPITSYIFEMITFLCFFNPFTLMIYTLVNVQLRLSKPFIFSIKYFQNCRNEFRFLTNISIMCMHAKNQVIVNCASVFFKNVFVDFNVPSRTRKSLLI